jgi:YggT family protein
MTHDREDDTNIERQRELQHDEEAFRLRQEEKRLRAARLNTPFVWIINTIFWLVGTLEILLGLRFLLRLFGANTQNEVARLINNLSAPFIDPFSTLFISPVFGGGAYIFDINIALAIGVYALLSYLAASLVRFIFYHES